MLALLLRPFDVGNSYVLRTRENVRRVQQPFLSLFVFNFFSFFNGSCAIDDAKSLCRRCRRHISWLNPASLTKEFKLGDHLWLANLVCSGGLLLR